MTEKELYIQKFQAELDAWNADISKLRALAMEAQTDAQLAINRHADTLEQRLKEAQVKLSAFNEATEDAVDSLKRGIESAWYSLKVAVGDAAAKYMK